MDIAARASQLFDIFESQKFDRLESLLTADAKTKQNGDPEHDVVGLMAFVTGLKHSTITPTRPCSHRSTSDRRLRHPLRTSPCELRFKLRRQHTTIANVTIESGRPSR
jgi:hypothetical protein